MIDSLATLTYPYVRNDLPGPNSAELPMPQQHRESSAHTYSRNLPSAIEERSGSFDRDLEGNVFIDFPALAKEFFRNTRFSTLTSSLRKKIKAHFCEPTGVDALWFSGANPLVPSACPTGSYSPSRGTVGKYELHVVDDFFHELAPVRMSGRVLY